MVARSVVLGIVATFLAVAAGCSTSEPQSSARPAATSYEEYAAAGCEAWDSLFKAIGNPDTGGGSDLSRALDEAISTRNAAAAGAAATEMARELDSGRAALAVAAGWQPRAEVIAQMDRLFVAYQAMTTAKLALARGEPNAGDPQAAFEAAGGIEAWSAMVEAMRAVGGGAVDSTARTCANGIEMP